MPLTPQGHPAPVPSAAIVRIKPRRFCPPTALAGGPGRPAPSSWRGFAVDIIVHRAQKARGGTEVDQSDGPDENRGVRVSDEDDLVRLRFRVASLESVCEHFQGWQSLRIMRRMDARRRNASAVRLRFSQSLARRRHRLSHAMVCSTTHQRLLVPLPRRRAGTA